jgi:hypothetical protein
MHPDKPSGIPDQLMEDLAFRDLSPLGENDFLKYQFISLSPGISHNFRYLLLFDGSLFFAANNKKPPKNPRLIFNSLLPETPSRILSEDEMVKIRILLDENNFFQQKSYQQNPVRDGGLVIITARLEDVLHEVWYVNVHNPLIDFLGAISPETPESKSMEDDDKEMEEFLREQERLLKKLENEFPDPDEDLD